LVNAGGLIHLAVAQAGGDAQRSFEALRIIPENLRLVLRRTATEGSEPCEKAEQIALKRLRAAG
jgi:hypothetical protein